MASELLIFSSFGRSIVTKTATKSDLLGYTGLGSITVRYCSSST